jgi:type IV secretory pathway VirB3-like protein
MELVIVAAAAVTLIVLVNAHLDAPAARRAMPVLLAAFGARLAVHVLVVRSGVIDYGGDNLGYEVRGMMILNSWKLDGFQFVTAADMEILGTAAVPCNVFALVMYLCGGPAPLACTAVVALLACALCVVMYRIARLIGADDRAAFRLLRPTPTRTGSTRSSWWPASASARPSRSGSGRACCCWPCRCCGACGTSARTWCSWP